MEFSEVVNAMMNNQILVVTWTIVWIQDFFLEDFYGTGNRDNFMMLLCMKQHVDTVITVTATLCCE